MKINNRIDVRDRNHEWLEAVVVAIRLPLIKVSFKGFQSKFDEVLDISQEMHKIKEVGALSGAHGWAKYSLQYQENLRQEMQKNNQIKN